MIIFFKKWYFFKKFPIYLKINFQNLKNSQFFRNFKNFGDFLGNGIFQQYFFSGFFRLFFFRWEFFGGVASMQKLVLFRVMRFSERFRHSFTSFGANFWIWGVRMVRIRGSAGMVLQHSLLGEFRQTVWTMYTKRSILPKIWKILNFS